MIRRLVRAILRRTSAYRLACAFIEAEECCQAYEGVGLAYWASFIGKKERDCVVDGLELAREIRGAAEDDA